MGTVSCSSFEVAGGRDGERGAEEPVPTHPVNDGIGKPDQLRHALAGARSRRICEEHRLVYLVDGDDVIILQARYRY